MKFKKSNLILISIISLISACTWEYIKPNVEAEPFYEGGILFLGHTYGTNETIDARLEKINFNRYDHIWLGGDICAESDHKRSTLEYLDSLFNLKSAGHYWALGNHDITYDHLDWIEETTGRNEFNVEHLNGMTVMVLNTNLYDPECDRMEEQFDMFDKVCDTIQESSHLVVLSHHVMWDTAPGLPNMYGRANANKSFWQSRCEPDSKFHHVLYDRLLKAQERGVQVVFISGDLGQKEKAFQQQCDNGMWFLGSGIDQSNKYMASDTARDKILYLEHNPAARTLDWQFLDLDSLSSL